MDIYLYFGEFTPSLVNNVLFKEKQNGRHELAVHQRFWSGNPENTRRSYNRNYKGGYEIGPESFHGIEKTYPRSSLERFQDMCLAITDSINLSSLDAKMLFTRHCQKWKPKGLSAEASGTTQRSTCTNSEENVFVQGILFSFVRTRYHFSLILLLFQFLFSSE